MKRYPINVGRDVYRGNNEARKRKQRDYNDAAASVEKYINDRFAHEPVDAVYDIRTDEVAQALGLDDELARRLIFSIDGGHNGATFYKGDFDRAIMRLGASE